MRRVNPSDSLSRGENMKVKAIVSTLVVCLVAALCLVATPVVMAKDNPHMGTWKLNEKKSKLTKGSTKNSTVVYEAAGDDIKVIVDGTDGDGNAVHNEWTGKFDGKFYPVTGDPAADQRSYKRINANTLALTGKKGSKI